MKRAPAKKRKLAAKRSVRKAAKSKKSKPAKKAKRPAAKAARRTAAKRPARKTRKTRDVTGEGNYTAAREFRKDEENFVRANKARIPEMGKEAERALEGSEGASLRQAEEEARSHARQ
ncbi:MAG: hypothetical protein ACTHLR_00295 [Rhizomicrobium sp.]